MSLVTRAIAAIALTVVFYLFAVAVAVGLIAFPVLRIRAGESPGLLGLFMPIVALCILVSLVPRRQRFEAPGPPVTQTDSRSCSASSARSPGRWSIRCPMRRTSTPT